MIRTTYDQERTRSFSRHVSISITPGDKSKRIDASLTQQDPNFYISPYATKQAKDFLTSKNEIFTQSLNKNPGSRLYKLHVCIQYIRCEIYFTTRDTIYLFKPSTWSLDLASAALIQKYNAKDAHHPRQQVKLPSVIDYMLTCYPYSKAYKAYASGINELTCLTQNPEESYKLFIKQANYHPSEYRGKYPILPVEKIDYILSNYFDNVNTFNSLLDLNLNIPT
jgi:hypothetical protein